ncbi:MAG TPA: response regulator [Balneolales bacterium]|nr:response regulator [Balneolales bacterium]HYX09573.1 response regulator [Bacteroidales bacterium]
MTKGTVLIVDDEQAIRESISLVLEDEGYNCLTAANGKKGLELIKSQKIDVLITDIHMPVMNGLDLFKKVKEVSQYTKTIIITAYSETDTAIETIHEGAAGYFIKPLDFDELIERVNSLTGK